MSKRECAVCGMDLSDQPMRRIVEVYQESKGTFYEDEMHELCPEHYAKIALILGGE